MRPSFCVAIAVLLVAPLACSDDERPAAAGSGESSTGGSSHAGIGSHGGQSNAGAPGAELGGSGEAEGGAAMAGSDPIGHVGGLGTTTSGGAFSDTPSDCDDVSWSEPVALTGISTPGADETLLTMTHDELSIVFSRDDALYVADRASAAAAFGSPAEVTLPAGYTHQYGLAISPDGLTLVAVSDTSEGFADISRAARQGAFDAEPSTARYDSIAYDANQYGRYLTWPVLSKSGESLFYTALIGDSSYVYHAHGQASFAVPAGMGVLGGEGGDLKLTQSVSADERVVYVFDQALGYSVGYRSSAPGAPYYMPVPFEALRGVFTNDGCSRLYGTADDGASLDVVIAENP
jgi:hypothetical protein